MRLRPFLLLCALCAPPVLAAPPASAAPAGASRLPYDMVVEKLPNGLQLVVVPMRSSTGLMAYYTLVRVGSRNEVERGRSGFAHFFEHMMFRGTKNVPAAARDAFLKRIGADDNGFTTDDFTCYTVFGANSQMDELVRIEADRFKNLEYDEDVFKTEAGAVLGEYNKSASNPLLKMEEKLAETAFTRHTYRHTTIGFKQDIIAMPRAFQYSRSFFRRWYTPDNTTLIVAGDVDPAEISRLVKKHYSDWSGRVPAAKVAPEPPQKSPRRATLTWPSETSPRMMIGYHTPAQDLSRKDTAVQSVLGAMLLGPASKLHRELVLEKGIVEDLSDWTTDHRDPHLFQVLVTFKDEKDRTEILTALEREIGALSAGNVDARLLADVKSNVRYSVLTSLETPEDVAGALVFPMGPSGDPRALERQLANLESVTAEDVATFAKTHLVQTNRTLVDLRSKGGAK